MPSEMNSNQEYIELKVPIFESHTAIAVLMKNVQNLEIIKENLIKGNFDYDYGFINAKNIVSLEQIYSAYYKVMQDSAYNTMKSRTLHTEFIYALSPFKNIMDCLNKFGISKTSDVLLILKIVKKEDATTEYFESQLKHIKTVVTGEIIKLDDENLQNFADAKSIAKNYKLKTNNRKSLDNDWNLVTRNVVSIIQLKGL